MDLLEIAFFMHPILTTVVITATIFLLIGTAFHAVCGRSSYEDKELDADED